MTSIGNKTKHLGRFKTERLASKAYRSARKAAAAAE